MDSISTIKIQDFGLWEKLRERRAVISFDLEITARCNNDCRHCYINLPANDRIAQSREMTIDEIGSIADQAVSLGAVWVLLSGGEPLLRPDFSDIYMLLKRKGLLVSVFTNGALINSDHVSLFRNYPPRDIEVTVYGVTAQTYEKVSRRPGSFNAFMRGLNLLSEAGVRVRLKAMAIRSNFKELPEIAAFCRSRTKDYFRFDPLLHLRFDRDEKRNMEIMSERLSPEEIVDLEKADNERLSALQKGCDKLIVDTFAKTQCDHLFHCGAGNGSFDVSYDGQFRLCSSLWTPQTLYDLRKGPLGDAWNRHVPEVRNLRSKNREFLEGCRRCPIVNLCLFCPAHSYLETGQMDSYVDYFCKVAHARADAIKPEEM